MWPCVKIPSFESPRSQANGRPRSRSIGRSCESFQPKRGLGRPLFPLTFPAIGTGFSRGGPQLREPSGSVHRSFSVSPSLDRATTACRYRCRRGSGRRSPSNLLVTEARHAVVGGATKVATPWRCSFLYPVPGGDLDRRLQCHTCGRSTNSTDNAAAGPLNRTCHSYQVPAEPPQLEAGTSSPAGATALPPCRAPAGPPTRQERRSSPANPPQSLIRPSSANFARLHANAVGRSSHWRSSSDRYGNTYGSEISAGRSVSLHV